MAAKNVADIGAPAARGYRHRFTPDRFVLSVKKDGTCKTISQHVARVVVENADMARETGFPVGTVLVANAYLPVGKADNSQLARAKRNWQAKRDAAGDKPKAMNVDEIDDVSVVQPDDDDAE